MSGQPAYNRLKVTRQLLTTRWWRSPPRPYRVTFIIERRDSFGLCEHRQVTFTERTVVKALREAGFVVFPPEDLR